YAYFVGDTADEVYLRKKCYGLIGIPTVKALQTRMRKDGIIVKLDYSSKEYAQIENVIGCVLGVCSLASVL
ncbi:hypothetical protein ACLBPA_29615, partial [Klebsiella pneumoniae]|uniref:hypothetical protein n=1 Tax=Klebsiella pneumoniae TaxID=573 RepID=UPI00396836DB